MPQWDAATLSEPQRRWFAAVRDGLERETGRTLEAWVEIARTCPETRPRARLTWMKTVHGLGQNRATLVLARAFPELAASTGDADPLWADPALDAIFQLVSAVATGLDGVVTGRRKACTAFSRRYQFAALRPVKAGVRLGLALAPDQDPRLEPPHREAWSERLTAALTLQGPEALDQGVEGLIRLAWERS